ncbi:uncharacterized protein [Palaemon carinicauda]|uniref:uncharacterized protein n=1 Tax=Palaemon carinicauda TaxID=392227 RepID=UPI0035B63C4D
MSLAVSSIGKAPPQVIRSKSSTQLLCSKLQDNGERSAQITKSTTLFPMRIYDKPVTMQHSDKKLKVNDNFKNYFPKINNFSNTLSDEKELYINGSKTIAQKYNGNEPKRKANISNHYHGGKFNTTNETEKMRTETAELNQIPMYVKCFTCYRIIKEEDFHKHLLFGHVKCSVCNAAFRDCSSFQVTKKEFARGNVLCKHMFYYCKDPVDYLIKTLSLGNIGNLHDFSCSAIRAKLMIKIYIEKLKSLENQQPWAQAIASCKEYMNGDESGEITNDIEHSQLCISLRENRNNDCHEIPERKKCTEVVLSQDYDISLLEKTTEFVKVLEPSVEILTTPVKETSPVKETLPLKETSPAKEKKIEKTRQKSPESQESSDEESIEFVPIPSDGFYYVSVKPIEECPNCYEVLCPSRFTVNVENFLMTVICEGCNLTIYITSAAPELQIITDDGVNQDTSLSKKEKEKAYHPQVTKKTHVKRHKNKKIKSSMLLH